MAKFIYYNNNPFGFEEDDCVTRAITLCSGLSYFDISNKLKLTGELLDCEKLCVCCYDFLIEKVLKFPKVEIDMGMTVDDFAKQHPKGIYLLRMEQHITSLIDGTIYDLWDCSDRKISHAWFCGY